MGDFPLVFAKAMVVHPGVLQNQVLFGSAVRNHIELWEPVSDNKLGKPHLFLYSSIFIVRLEGRDSQDK